MSLVSLTLLWTRCAAALPVVFVSPVAECNEAEHEDEETAAADRGDQH